MSDSSGLLIAEDMPQNQPRDFFIAHCQQPGGMILVQVIDIFGDTATTAIYNDYDEAWKWSRQFSDDSSIESCLFIPHTLNFPDHSIRGKLH